LIEIENPLFRFLTLKYWLAMMR